MSGAQLSLRRAQPMSKLLKILDFSCFAEVRSAGAGTKKCTFFDTFSLTRTCDHKFRKCHSELDSCPFDPTLVSAASSVTELQIVTRVGHKGQERSSRRRPRVPKWRKKANFLVKSSGKIGGFRDGGQIVHSRSALAYANRKPCTRGLHSPALQ